MDKAKEQSIIEKLQTIKCEDETCDIRVRKLKSLINQMNLRLMQNPDEKATILSLQKQGYEAIVAVLDSDKQSNQEEITQQKGKIQNLISIVKSELQTL